MKNKDDRRTHEQDPHIAIPSEANTTKHINFLDAESNDNDTTDRRDDETKERQRQWREGLEEGRKANNQQE
jgi:hypothetical protein